MRSLLFFAAFFLPVVRGFAQWNIGLGGGFSSNSLQTDITNRPQQSLRPATGLFFELPLDYSMPLTKDAGAGSWGVTVRAAFVFIQKGYVLDRTDTLQGLDQQYLNTYVQVPLTALLFFKRKSFCFQLGGGYYMGYWASGRIKGGMPDIFNTALAYPATYRYDEAYGFDDRKDNRWENGWTAEGRFSVKVEGSLALFLAGHFFQAVTDQQKAYMLQQLPRNNSTWALSLGLQKEIVW